MLKYNRNTLLYTPDILWVKLDSSNSIKELEEYNCIITCVNIEFEKIR